MTTGEGCKWDLERGANGTWSETWRGVQMGPANETWRRVPMDRGEEWDLDHGLGMGPGRSSSHGWTQWDLDDKVATLNLGRLSGGPCLLD